MGSSSTSKHSCPSGQEIDFDGSVSTLWLTDFYIENRCMRRSLLVTGYNVWDTLYYCDAQVKFFIQRLRK
ncbi:hypothetical protein [Staphylococcus phage vB_SauH_DELF3]|nr:hypothetical protein [Staphylococcus phage vB_SauH_DELF3]